MNWTVRKSEYFIADFDLQYRWYFQEAGGEVARRYLLAVDETLQKISQFREIGTLRNFSQPELRGLRSFRVEPPFDRHLIFYRVTESHIDAWRLLHGARDLPKQLIGSKIQILK